MRSFVVTRGSCWEILDHLITGHDEGFLFAALLSRGRDLGAHVVKLLDGYMNYLKRAQKTVSVVEPITHN